MNNKTVLCEIAFLEKFLECYPDSPPFPDDKVQLKLKTWIELYAFLSRSNKQLDCSPRSLAEAAQRDKNLAYFWKKSTEGASRLDFSDGFDDLEILGTTVDDSVGEAFDKVAKFYGLGYPGGVIIDNLAKNGDPKSAKFPVPKLDETEHRYDVSFSGLKTAVIHQCDLFWQPGYEHSKENMCAAFQETAIKTLVGKLLRAVDDTGLKTVVCGGGVAANSRLRAMLAERTDINCIFPPLKLCGDNGAMIAGVAYHFLQRGDRSDMNTVTCARIPQFKRGLEQVRHNKQESK